MRTAGIIAEYNPFHNGHAWQIAELKKRGFEAVVCVCSPGVVQRGTAALFPARVRTRAALAAGADLVLSLPAPYATLSAEGFAAAGVALLSALGCVDALCFGTETRRLEDIAQTAALLESPDFPAALRGQLDAGLPLPAARAAAAEALCPGAGAVLRAPNDILGVEYCILEERHPFPLSQKHGNRFWQKGFPGSSWKPGACRRRWKKNRFQVPLQAAYKQSKLPE